jgi:hypothetical protein
MAQKKHRTFNAGAVVREIARERIGQPRPTAVLIDKRYRKATRQIERELRSFRSC